MRSGTPLVRMAKGDFSCARMAKGDLDYLLRMLAPVAFAPRESSNSARVGTKHVYRDEMQFFNQNFASSTPGSTHLLSQVRDAAARAYRRRPQPSSNRRAFTTCAACSCVESREGHSHATPADTPIRPHTIMRKESITYDKRLLQITRTCTWSMETCARTRN